MKVGIVTIFAVPNYGAMLQSYGLSSYLRGLGIDAEVVNYRQPALEDYFRFRLGFPPALKHWMRLRAGSAFVEQRLHKSPRQLRSVDEFMREADGYDALITGSDQVWFTGPVQYYDPMFFLDLPEARARKISYAASAGGNKTFGEHEDKVRTALSRFDHIGVRDAHTASLVRPLTDKPFTHTVDPVFVHDFAELLDERPPSSEPYVLVFGDFRGPLAEVVRKVRRQTGIAKVVTLQYPCPEATLRLAEGSQQSPRPVAQGAACRGDCGASIAESGRSHRPVARGPAGVNGLHDLGGNAWEWVDQGSDADRRTRGGSWWYGAQQMRADHLQGKPADTAVVYIGFRCARDYVR